MFQKFNIKVNKYGLYIYVHIYICYTLLLALFNKRN